MQDTFSSLLAPVLLDDVGSEHAPLLGIGRRKKSELKTPDGKKGERNKGRGRGELRRPIPPSLGSLPTPIGHFRVPKTLTFKMRPSAHTTFPVKMSFYLHENEKSFPYQRLST